MNLPHWPDATRVAAHRDGPENNSSRVRHGGWLDDDGIEANIGRGASVLALTVQGTEHNTSADDELSNTGHSPRRHPRIPRHRISILDEIFNFYSAT